MSCKIAIKGLKLFGKHGVTDVEKNAGQTFTIDVEMEFDDLKGSKTDNLKDTIDYVTVIGNVENIFNSKRFNLLEALASEIADGLMESFHAKLLKVKIKKTDPPIDAELESVGIVLERTR